MHLVKESKHMKKNDKTAKKNKYTNWKWWLKHLILTGRHHVQDQTRLGYPNSDQNQTTKEWGSGI